MLELIPLGTSAAIPTRDRHLSAAVVMHEGKAFLLDCGEGTQFQLLRAKIKRTQIRGIFITHAHGDHLFGLMGLLSTLSMLARTTPLVITGPVGIGAYIDMAATFSGLHLPFALDVRELHEADPAPIVFEDAAVVITARALDHRIPAFGYRVQERTRPGKVNGERARAWGITEHAQFQALKSGQAVSLPDGRVVQPEELVGPPRPGGALAYCFDTRPCAGSLALAQGVDLLYHEATFMHDMHERARETGHSTAREAAEIAQRANVKHLLLGHFSARYPETDELVAEARKIFPNTQAATALVRYPIAPLIPANRGEIHLS